MKVAIVNLGQIVAGDWRNPFAKGDAIISDGERIASVGTASAQAGDAADVVIDAGAPAIVERAEPFVGLAALGCCSSSHRRYNGGSGADGDE